jgi:Pentapeptide repeats (8 copies)
MSTLRCCGPTSRRPSAAARKAGWVVLSGGQSSVTAIASPRSGTRVGPTIQHLPACRQACGRRTVKPGRLRSQANTRAGGARVPDGDLQSAILSAANLEDAFLGGANLEGATLWGAKLSGAEVANAQFAGSRLDGVDLSKAKTALDLFAEVQLSEQDEESYRELVRQQFAVAFTSEDTKLRHRLKTRGPVVVRPRRLRTALQTLRPLHKPKLAGAWAEKS